jgi:hypothetical protein
MAALDIVFAASILKADFNGYHAEVLAIDHGNGCGHWAINRNGIRVYNSRTENLRKAIEEAEKRA